eukprot:TRINITY_DN18185_c0_g1_i1.p1 TRINITY_DN18185_c0_g1~~TRINITY_DN18185_c0_g1_i1.p1  ORF type:complete len:197 (+),score=35.65 TRINITY_DN18185_c0_g1_i1:201-791(+)
MKRSCPPLPEGAPRRRRAGAEFHVVEDHDEVLPHIHAAIRRKRLPWSGISIVHFDAHPDMLAPEGMDSEVVFDAHELYDTTGIADWILPLVYAGHVAQVVWLKPVWATQIDDGQYSFLVGRDACDGTIKVSSDQRYFCEEGLWAHETQLHNPRPLTLHVITVAGPLRTAALPKLSEDVILDFCFDFFVQHLLMHCN